MPKVSVVCAAYNHEKYVDEAIQSVLDQSFEDLELIVTDDHSTDRTVEKLHRFNDPRLKLLCNEANEGCSPTYNRSFAHSTGEYIAWLDTDDVYERDHLATLVNYLDRNPDKLGVFGLAKVINGNGEPIAEWSSIGVGADRYQLLRQLFRRDRPFCNASGLVRRGVIENLGHMAPVFGQSHDTALWMKILFEGDLAVLPDFLLRYRRHDTNRSGGETAANLNRGTFENFELLNIYLDRIKTAELLEKIFPEVHETKWPVDDRFVEFHLANLAMSCDSACNQLFGLHLLHELMKDPETAALLKSECNFSYNNLFHFEESLSLFSNGSVQLEIESLRSEIRRAGEKNEEMFAGLATAHQGITELVGLKEQLEGDLSLRTELTNARREIQELMVSKERLESNQARLERELDAMRKSRLWKTASHIRRLLLPWR